MLITQKILYLYTCLSSDDLLSSLLTSSVEVPAASKYLENAKYCTTFRYKNILQDIKHSTKQLKCFLSLHQLTQFCYKSLKKSIAKRLTSSCCSNQRRHTPHGPYYFHPSGTLTSQTFRQPTFRKPLENNIWLRQFYPRQFISETYFFRLNLVTSKTGDV